MIKIGGNGISAAYIGAAKVVKMYLGSVEVYSASQPPVEVWEVVNSTNSGAAYRRYINSSNVWKSETSTTTGAIFAVTPGKTYRITADHGNITYAMVTERGTANNAPVSYADGSSLTQLASGNSVTLVAPSNAVWLYTSRKSSNVAVLPTVEVLVQ